jgi:hypothetical protein
VAIGASLGLFLHGLIHWWLLIPYLIICFVSEDSLKDFPQWIGDMINGACFALLVLFL